VVQVVVVLVHIPLEQQELLALQILVAAVAVEQVAVDLVALAAQALSSSLTLALSNLVAVSSHPWVATLSTPS
jgi:hypothetical protein